MEITASDGRGGEATDSFVIDVSEAVQAAAKPNILFILSDDQGLDSSAQYNAPHTPFHLPPEALHSRTLSGSQADIDANPRDDYLAAIEAMDTEFGRFWDSLDAQARADTVVIYLGDNGTPARVADGGTDLRGTKNTLYQGGIAAPLFVSGRSGVR